MRPTRMQERRGKQCGFCSHESRLIIEEAKYLHDIFTNNIRAGCDENIIKVIPRCLSATYALAPAYAKLRYFQKIDQMYAVKYAG